MEPAVIVEACLLAVLVAATWTDVSQGKVYNKLTYTAVIVGLLLNGLLRPPGGIGWTSALLGFLVGFVPLFVVYLAGGLGGGDVKLMGVTGAFLGPETTLWALLYTCILGAVLSVAWILWREGFTGLILRVQGAFSRRARWDGSGALRFPFALAIFLGAVWIVTERHLGTTLIESIRGNTLPARGMG